MSKQQRPFALSLSKGRPSFESDGESEVRGFDKLSPNGFGSIPQ